jgi:N-acetylglutamate synthase-like GNAT family acetyltransferase
MTRELPSEKRIRPYRAGDYENVIAFFSRIFREMGGDFIPDGRHVDIRDIGKTYQGEGRAFLVLEVNGSVAGGVGLRPLSPTIGEMKRLYLAQEIRGMGFGREMSQRIIAEARAAGYERLRLDTMQGTRSEELFRKLGFYPIEPYYEPPLPDMVFMQKTLEPAENYAA